MITEELIKALSILSSEGISAFYAYLALEVFEFSIFMGLLVWGARTIWPVIKKELQD